MKKRILILSALICSVLTASCEYKAETSSVTMTDISESVSAEITQDILYEESHNAEESVYEESETSLSEESVQPLPPDAQEVGVTQKGYKIISVNGVIYINGTLIVNKTYPLPKDYSPNGITPETEEAYRQLCEAAKNDGVTIFTENDYRSYELQEMLYTTFCNRDGKEQADRYSARPGHSEHQSGMAIDVNKAGSSFTGTKEAVWLKNNCAEYGFIIRYPEGKESVTGYMYESWHIRYVGKELAQKLYLGNGEFTTLEEYFGITSEYTN